MRSVILRTTLALIGLASLSSPARAGFLTTNMDTSTPILTFTVPSGGINGESAYVGPNTVSYNGATPGLAYCTDFFRSIGVKDGYAATIQPLSTLAGGDLVARLFTADATLGGSNATDRAALQIAIWDAVESNRAGSAPLDPLTTGTLTSGEYNVPGAIDVTSSNLSLISVMDRVSALLTKAGTVGEAQLVYYAPTTSYGQGFVAPALSAQVVPEPSSAVLVLLGVGGLVGVYSRRRLLLQRAS